MSVVSYGREKGYPKFKGNRDFKTGIITETHTDRYVVMVDDENDTNRTIADDLPFNYGDLFIGSGSVPAFLADIGLDRDTGNRLKWYLDLTYIPLSLEDQQDQQQPPESRRPKWRWGYDTIERVVTQDRDGDPIVNAVGEPIEYTEPLALPILTISRFQLSFDPDTIHEYVNHVNSDSFWGADPGQALMFGIEDEEDSKVIWNQIKYRRVTYVIKFAVPVIEDSLEGWDALLLNRGTFYINDDGLKQHFRDEATGALITGNLEFNGQKLDDGVQPRILKFQPKKEANFGTLNLGPNF